MTIEVDAPDGSAEWVKEHLSMYLEKWGDVRVTKVEEVRDQMEIGGNCGNNL